MAYKVYLKKNEEKRILFGHSWVYANEVARIEGKDKNGSLAEVYSSSGQFLGKGYINHRSKLLVRIFIRSQDVTDDKELYLSRLAAADLYRRHLGYENCYRMVFAEADDLPALIVDKYRDTLVVQFLSLGVDMRKGLIVECLTELFKPQCIYERSDVAVRVKEGLSESKGVLYGKTSGKVQIEENGIKMAVDIENGQKTGYFLDQKENRLALRRYCKGARVLDCFCNSGGFSMNAATVADSVLAVDISTSCLESVRENATLNGFDNITTREGDVFEVLRELKRNNELFDTVILDPPAFCKSAAEIKDAIRGYTDINSMGLKLVKRGGYLVTSSCSQHITSSLFSEMLYLVARNSKRSVKVVELKGQAPDHPSLLAAEETNYLKFYVLKVD